MYSNAGPSRCSDMKTITYKVFKSLDKQTTVPGVIPKLIFRTGPFRLCEAPDTVKYYLDKVVIDNPDYTQVYFDDHDCRDFILDYFPEYVREYDSLVPTAYKADLWRLLVMYKYGGIYNDIGHIYLQPISEIVSDNDELILTLDHIEPKDHIESQDDLNRFGLHNAFFACYPGHEVIKHFIDHVVENIQNKYYGTDCLEITGPLAWGKCFTSLFNLTSPLQVGVHSFRMKNGNGRIKIVNFYAYEFQDPRNVITNIDGLSVIQSKFENYYNIMYTNHNVIHYGILWKDKKVYK